MRVNNVKFVAILIRFLGTCALLFCLRWANTACALWHGCSTQVKPRRSEIPRYLVSGEKYAVHGFTVSAHVEHASQRTSCTGPAKTTWQRTRSSESDEYHYEFGVIKFYFTSDIWKITKSEEYYNLTGFFLHKMIFFLEQKGISATALIHVAKTESLSTCRIFSKLPFCRQNARRRQH